MSRLALLMFIALGGTADWRGEIPFAANVVRDAEGGVIRGDVKAKRLALMFTGDQFGEVQRRFWRRSRSGRFAGRSF